MVRNSLGLWRYHGTTGSSMEHRAAVQLRELWFRDGHCLLGAHRFVLGDSSGQFGCAARRAKRRSPLTRANYSVERIAGLTPRWSRRVIDKVPSSRIGVRAAQLNRQAS